MLRTITLSLLMLISVVAMLPFASSTAHGVRQSVSSSQRHYRRHSRAWWRRYRARLRRKREASLAAHRLGLLSPMPTQTASLTDPLLSQMPTILSSTAASAKADMDSRGGKAQVELPGQISLSVVALSRATPSYLTAREESKMLAGINVAELRRTVIDKMLTSGGWVTNDFIRDVNGQKVFVVTAKTPADGRSPEQAWSFYFTELNGRIYNLTTNTPAQFSDRMQAEAARFIDSLRARSATSTTNR
jgi:hypothetical protein